MWIFALHVFLHIGETESTDVTDKAKTLHLCFAGESESNNDQKKKKRKKAKNDGEKQKKNAKKKSECVYKHFWCLLCSSIHNSIGLFKDMCTV